MSNEIVEKSVESQLTSDYAQLSQWIKDTAASTGSFLNEQTPLFIQEYLNWMFYSNLVCAVFFTALPVLILFISMLFFKKAVQNKENKDVAEGLIFGGSVGLVLAGISFIVFLMTVPQSSFKCLKVKIAPRVMMVEKVGELIK